MFKPTCVLYRYMVRFAISPALVAVIVGVLSASAMRADVIAGPSLPTSDGGWNLSGFGFTALVNATLTSFTFQNQGKADTIDLVDPLGNILDSVAIPAATPSDTVTVNWALAAGNQYYLLQTTTDNSQFNTWGLPAPSDTQIALIDTGDFGNGTLAEATFGIGGGELIGFGGTVWWAGFNNITTTNSLSSVPEPSSAFLISTALLGIAFVARKRIARSRAQTLPPSGGG